MPAHKDREVGRRIAVARRLARMTQQELADSSAVSYGTVRAVERGARLPSDEVLEELAALEQELRAHVTPLLPAAETVVDQLWGASLEGGERRDQLKRIRENAATGLGLSLATPLEMQRLGRDCRALLAYAESAP
ncbi:DUF6415 family natural product biosynthesis protein [Streptomyces phytohabitans]|uniref:DUF6415 family natural product biosynthesis protein n=1 Tax=Streptomyces phytohabitans TaxID=1150371 RepID=UPI00345C0F1B